MEGRNHVYYSYYSHFIFVIGELIHIVKWQKYILTNTVFEGIKILRYVHLVDDLIVVAEML